jgi:hypothetical protein
MKEKNKVILICLLILVGGAGFALYKFFTMDPVGCKDPKIMQEKRRNNMILEARYEYGLEDARCT